MSLQELKKKETLEVDALKEKAVTIFLQSSFHKLSGTWSWDMESEAVFCSDVILSLPINFIGTKGIFHPDDVEAVKEKIAGGQSFLHHLEFRFITTYGLVQTLSGQDIAIEIADDDVSNCVQQLADLEARDRKEKGEHRHLQLLHEIYLQSERFFNGGIWYYNRATTQTWYSDYIFRLHGLPPQSLNAHLHTFNEFIHPEDRDLVVDYVEKAFQEASPLYFEYRIITANSEKYLAYKSQWFYSEKGEAILYGTLQDVTEQKSAEQETAAYKDLSQFQKQQLVFNEQHVSIGHWQIDLLTRKSVYSDNYYRIFGLKPGTASPHINSFINFIHPDDQELVAASHKKMIYEHAAPDLEFRVLRADGKTRYISQKAKLVMHNGNMIISGIIQDVTVQRLLEKKVGELNEQALVQRQQLMQVDEIGSTGSWFVDLQTGTTTWSDNFYKLLGYKTQLPELSQRTLLSMVHPQDVKKFKEAWNTVLEQKQEAIFQFRLLLRGAERHMKAVMRIHLVKDKEFFIGTLQDITLENVLQQQLASRMQLAESLTENILDRIIVTDVNNTVVLWNKACETAYGVKKEAAIGQNFFDLFPQRKTEEETQAIYQVLRGEKVVMEASRSHWGPGYYDVNMMPLYTADEVSGIMRIVHDVTKETELRIDLRGRLNFIEKLLESSVDRIVALDRNLNYQYWNSKAEEYYGIPKKKVIGKNVLEVFPQIRNDPSFTEFRRALTGETVHISANFEQGKYFETYLIPILSDKDETTGVLWIAHDLTKEMAMQEEQRKAQTLLEQEHQRLKEAQAIGRVGSFEWSVGSRVSYWSDELYRINGLAPQSEEITLEKVDRFVHPDDRALLDQVKKESMQKPGSYNHVHRIIRKDGEVRWVNHAWESLADEENRVQKVIGIVQDITEQKKAEDELKESQLFTEKVMDATPDFIFVFNLVTGKNEFVNQSAYKGDAVRYEETLHISYEQLLQRAHPDDRESLHQFIEHFKSAADNDIYELDYRVVKGSETTWYRSRGKVFKRDEKGMPTHYISVVQDITSHKLAEQQREEQAYFLRRITETVPDMISVMEMPSRKTHFLNKELFITNGFDPEKMAGENRDELALYIHPDDQDTLKKYFELLNNASDTEIATAEYRARAGKGEWNWFLARGKVFQRGAAGNVTQILNAIVNITNRKKAEQELKENKLLIEDITRTTPDLISIHDAVTNQIIYVNHPGFWSEFYNDDEFHQLDDEARVARMIHPDDIEKATAFVNQRKLLPDKKVLETELKMKSGRWVRIKSKVFKRDDQGNVTQIISFSTDITAQKNAQQEVEKNLTILKQAEDIAAIGSWEYQIPSGRFSWSDGMYRIFDYPMGAPVQPEIYLHQAIEGDRAVAKRIIKNIRKNYQPIEETMRINRKDGVRLIKIKAAAVRDENGVIQKMVGVDRDITHLHETEEKLKQSQHWLAETAKASPDAITVYDLQKKQPLYLNDCLEKWTGKTLDELVEMGIDGRLQLIHRDDRLNLLHFNEKIAMANDGDVLTLEYRLLSKDEQFRWIRNRSKIFQRDESGKVTHILSILQEVSEEKAAERLMKSLNASLEKKNRELEGKNEEITSFAFVASHDLKEPIRKIHTFSDWLLHREPSLSDAGKENLQRLIASIKRLNTLIDDILALTKVHVDKEDITDVDLNVVLQRALQEMNEPIEAAGAEVTANHLPTVKGVENHLLYLFKNLIGNSIKFQSHGNKPVIRIAACTEDGSVKLSFADNGIGFSPVHKKKIFQMFRRLHGRDEYEGTGMGLAICKRIMEKHAGDIIAESEEGKGATFTCLFRT